MIEKLTFTPEETLEDLIEQRDLYAHIITSLVLCRQCRHYDDTFEVCLHEWNGERYKKEFPPDGYCSYGKRDTDGQE